MQILRPENGLRMTASLVGAPLVGAHHKGTHEGCPYETGLVAAKGRSAQHVFKVPYGSL